jgi:hypothetical protein
MYYNDIEAQRSSTLICRAHKYEIKVEQVLNFFAKARMLVAVSLNDIYEYPEGDV